jgi:hypothetical protein
MSSSKLIFGPLNERPNRGENAERMTEDLNKQDIRSGEAKND